MAETFDVIVIGGGIAGIGAAAEISAERSVIVLERESAPGMHATGRSAAAFLLNYGNPAVRRVTRAAEPFYLDPDPAFWPEPLLTPRGELFLARPGEEPLLTAHLAAAPTARAITPSEAVAIVPILRPETFAAAAHDPNGRDIDVDLLLQGWIRRLRRNGGRIDTGAEALSVSRNGGLWSVATRTGTFSAPVLVNAAGAWVDAVAGLAGVPPIGIRPLRRSAAILPAPEGHDPMRWPLFGPLAEDWYARPTGGKLMVSPADEDPVEPHDAWPDDMVLAEGLDRFEQMVTVPVTRVERSWAGLRSFVADRTPVAGFDPQADGFFWLAGQGGYGIQTAPALARLAADLIAGRPPALDPATVAALDPGRPGLRST
jgi:D-arginine dehydrogenase